MPLGTPLTVDELLLLIDDVVTIDGSPHPVLSAEDNPLRQQLIQSFKPQTLRKFTNGIGSPDINFFSSDCYFFNLSSGNYTLDSFTNSLQGREIKLVIFGVNRFLINPAFANITQIGTHIKGETNICFVDCVPDQNGNDLFVFRWINSSVVNYNEGGDYAYLDQTNAEIQHKTTCEDTNLSTNGQATLILQNNGYSKYELTNEIANEKVRIDLSKSGYSQVRVEKRDSVDNNKVGLFYGRVSSDSKIAQSRLEQTALNYLDQIVTDTLARLQTYQAQFGNIAEILTETTGEANVNLLAKNGKYPIVLFQNGTITSTLKYVSGDLPAWDMDSNQFLGFALGANYGFINALDVQSISICILDDSDNEVWDITSGGLGSFKNVVGTPSLELERFPAGRFDNANFSGSASSRGRWSITFK